VRAVKKDPSLIDAYAVRIGRIDRRAFESRVRMAVPLWFGLLLLLAATATGIIAILAAVELGPCCLSGRADRLRVLFVPASFLVGLGALIIGTHSLAHWIVGTVLGIRFTHVFLGGPKPPRPGVKSDYASYLRASPRARAWMHASGAIVTKIVPFALVPAAMALYDEWPFLVYVVVAVGIAQIVTDVVLSTKVSDWMKFSRELRSD
jgi:hypothetical protein